MREDSFTLDKCLTIGLLPLEKFKRNVPGLQEAYNCVIGPEGILEYTPMTNPFVGLPACSWPYPQVFNTNSGIYVATQTAIYKANSSYVCTAMITGIQAGNLWEMTDYTHYQVWTNGVSLIVRDAETGTFAKYPMSHSIETLCDYNGQMVFGNFGGDKDNWIAWSGIGKVYLDDLLSKEDRTNTAGFMPMNFRGDVYRVKKLGDKIMVYGSTGISAIKPGSVRPYKTMAQFGREDIFNFGIAGKGCVGGDDKIHIFLDNYGYLHAFDQAGKHTKLGYNLFMNNFVDDIVITHDSLHNDFYISDGSTCYMLRAGAGMSQLYQCPSGIVRQGSVLYGVSYDNSDTSAYITTNGFDMLTRSIKTMQTVEASMTGTVLQGAVDYKFLPNDTWTRGMVKNMSRHGTFMPMISGVDFRIHIKASTYADFSVDTLIARYKLSDKRTIRGPYAQPTDL